MECGNCDVINIYTRGPKESLIEVEPEKRAENSSRIYDCSILKFVRKKDATQIYLVLVSAHCCISFRTVLLVYANFRHIIK